MASMNKVILLGNLTKDPDMRMMANGNPMTRLGLAVNRKWLDKEGQKRDEASFFNLVAYSKTAEFLGQYSRKGRKVLVDGRLQTRTVTNEKGENKTYHNIIVNDCQFLDYLPPEELERAKPAEDGGSVAGSADDFITG